MTAKRKPSIPSVRTQPPELVALLSPIKENIEIITGVLHTGVTLSQLSVISANASTAQIITAINNLTAAVNNIVVRLNATGQ